MVITRIEICNFRIFYKINVFELSKGINLIVGANGTGKTAFYDALEWLFRTDEVNKMAPTNISMKRREELHPNDSDDVRVAITYDHNRRTKVLEKMYRFTKSLSGEITISNYSFSLIDGYGIERTIKDGSAFDQDLPAELRMFIMFKEGVFYDLSQKSNSLKLLADSLSSISDYYPYLTFMDLANRNAERVRDTALKMDRKNIEKIKQLKKTIAKKKDIISEIEREIKNKKEEEAYFEKLLKNIEKSSEASILLNTIKNRIEILSAKRTETTIRMREDYSRNLLEEMWILVGFEKIAEEYSAKIDKVEKKRRSLKSNYLLEQGVKRALKAAELGSSLQNDIPKFFKHDYISELQKRGVILNDDISKVKHLRNVIEETISLNCRLREDIKKIDVKLAEEYDIKKRIIAQSDGLTEEQLLLNYNNISRWMEKRNKTIIRIDILKRDREQHRAALEEAEYALSKFSEGTEAEMYTKTVLIFQQITNAFKNAKEETRKQCLMKIENKANMYLSRLLPDDFIATIKIIEKQDVQSEILLMDGAQYRIFNPSYSLRKASLIATMLALGKISSENNCEEYPLIYEGSLSDYDNIIGNSLLDIIDRQMIVLTSDFMERDTEGIKKVNKEALPSILSRIYHLEMKKTCKTKELSSLQISISQIK